MEDERGIIGGEISYRREDRRLWRGAPEKSVVAAELAPDLCSAHVASRSLPRERGKGKYSTRERGSHRLLVVPPVSSLPPPPQWRDRKGPGERGTPSSDKKTARTFFSSTMEWASS